jgi:large subunit ribosomal protein L13
MVTKTLTKTTKTPTVGATELKWYVMDAKGQVLGRLASRAAEILLGKSKPQYVASQNFGDHLVIINAKHIAVTGRKEDKKYFSHSGFPGGLKETSLSKLRQTYPDRIIYAAIKGMLPKNRLANERLKRLHLFAGDEHNFGSRELMEVKLG